MHSVSVMPALLLPREQPQRGVQGQQRVRAGCGCLSQEEHVQRDLSTPGNTRKKSRLKLRLDNRESSCSEVCSSQQPWGHLFLLSPTQLCNRALCCETNPAGRLMVVFWRKQWAPCQAVRSLSTSLGPSCSHL